MQPHFYRAAGATASFAHFTRPHLSTTATTLRWHFFHARASAL